MKQISVVVIDPVGLHARPATVAVNAASKLVDTLCGLSGIQRVQIMVDGSSDWNFRESYSLSEPYERNLDLVKKEK